MTQSIDPRTSLNTYGTPTSAQQFAAAQYVRFYDTPPSRSTDLMKLWFSRGQNFVVGFLRGEPGAAFTRDAQVDEYVVLTPDPGTAIEITWEGATFRIPGASIAFVPPGRSTVRMVDAGRLLLMYSTVSEDLCAMCINAAAYAERHPNIPPFEPWPEAQGQRTVRHYSLDVPDEPGRFGRIWRCSTFMVNFLPPQIGPRDVTKLSPHHHDSFEQGSFALDGAFTHHVRWPWTPNLHTWRADEHEYCGSPSLTVIPPPAIHTSRGMDDGMNQLIDIFCPPRVDFSMKPGWVLNSSDYPMPLDVE